MINKSSKIKSIFKEQGLAPKKWMGQNLLVDSSYLERIVAAVNPAQDEALVEVGAGLGALTEALIARGARVWAIELDAGFFRALEDKFAGSSGITLVHRDALKYDFRALAAEIGKLRVAANLPYNISSRLLFLFFENRDVFSGLHILLQKEVAERLLADPGSKDYGILTVLMAASARTKILFDIPPRAFYPVPEVVSSFVRVEFPDPPPVVVSDLGLFTRLVKASFSGRRKTLRNTLVNLRGAGLSQEIIHEAAAEVGIELMRRGETLSPEEFGRFADAIAGRVRSRTADDEETEYVQD